MISPKWTYDRDADYGYEAVLDSGSWLIIGEGRRWTLKAPEGAHVGIWNGLGEAKIYAHFKTLREAKASIPSSFLNKA